MNISEYRTQFALFNSSLELARYRYHVGLTSEIINDEIYDRYSDLFSITAIADLRFCLEQTPADFETERTGLQRLLSDAQLRQVELRASQVTKELAYCESSERIEWTGEKISLEDIPALLASEANKSQRGELAGQWADSIPVCDELRNTRLESFSQSARSLVFGSYGELVAEATNTKVDRINLAAQSLLEQTETDYASALAKLMARDLPEMRPGDLDFADLPYVERTLWLDKFLAGKDFFRIHEETMRGLGIRLDKQPNIKIDTQKPRSARGPAAACFPVSPPDDVRLAIALQDGPFLGWLHQAGKAQHHAWCSRDLAKRHPEFVYSADSATTEGYAFLFSYLPLDPKWLLEFLPNINVGGAAEIARDAALHLALHLRCLCADALYWTLLHDAGQSSLEQLQSAYVDLHERATSFRARPELFLLNLH